MLIHGWNPDSNSESYADEFASLDTHLRSQVANSDWKLLKYHWEADADTGGKISFSAVDHGTRAAEIAHQHGQHLGELLNETCPNLEKIHFIAHSAGSWAARAATRFLLERNPTVVVQVTLLDPFMPDAAGAASSLGTTVMNQLDSVPGNERIYRLENYYSLDITGKGTEAEFIWRSGDTNLLVNLKENKPYYGDEIPIRYGHFGPIQFYADTVITTEIPTPPIPPGLVGVPFNFTTVGWYRSLFYMEPLFPRISTQPEDRTAPLGSSANLTVVATSSRPLSYKWWKVGRSVPIGVDPTLNLLAADVNEGEYVVEVHNDFGSTFSRKVSFTVTPTAGPTITAPPLDQMVAEGKTATFTVMATGTGLTYQWQRNGLDIPGETRTSYTTSPTLGSNNGFKYRVRVSSGGVSVYTRAATLIVESSAVSNCNDTNEPNNSSLTATPLAMSVAANGYVCTATDVDWFKVVISSPGLLRLDLAVPAANDYDLELFGPDTGYIAGSYNNAGLPENITHNAVVTGTYYVRVYGYPVGNGSFNPGTPFMLTANSNSGAIAITSPTSNFTYTTGSSTVSLGGTASDKAGVTQVAWTNDRGGGGIARGTTAWSITGISLQTGLNVITVSARNGAGSVVSTTLTVIYATLPTVTTVQATEVRSDGGTLNGTVNPKGVPTTAWFEWGTSLGLGFSTAPRYIGSSSSEVTMSANLSDLRSGVNFFFRTVAVNSAGTSKGFIGLPFTTIGIPIINRVIDGTSFSGDPPSEYRGRITLFWQPEWFFESFEVWRSETNDIATAALIQSGIRQTITYDDYPPNLNTRYFYWVRAVAGSGKGDFSYPASGVAISSDKHFVVIDKSQNVYLAGNFTGIARFGSITLTNDYFMGPGMNPANQAYLAKLNVSGQYQWVKHIKAVAVNNGAFTGSENEETAATAVAPDGAGGVYLAGTFLGIARFGNITLTNDYFMGPGMGSIPQAYLAKLNASGDYQWVKHIKAVAVDNGAFIGSENEESTATAVSADGAGGVYLAGTFLGIARFGSITLTNDYFTGPGMGSIPQAYLAKLNANGGYQWVKHIKAVGVDNGPFEPGAEETSATALATDGTGGVYLAGTFLGIARFGNITLTNDYFTGPGMGSIPQAYLAKLNASGDYQWVKHIKAVGVDNGPFEPGAEETSATAVATDGTGGVYLTGTFAGTVTFGSTILTNDVHSGNPQAYVIRIKPNGDHDWALSVLPGNGSASTRVDSLAYVPNEQIYLAGPSLLNAGVHNRARFTLTNPGGFLAKLTINPVDASRPTVAITAPTANQRWSNEVFTVRGTASDNAALASVQYQLNGAAWSLATTANNWSNWTVVVNLTPGTNTLNVYSMDLTRNLSPTNSMSFVYVLSAPLTVGITGKGTLTPNLSNAVLEIGKLNTITATPAAGYVFSNWTDGSGLPVTSNRALQFTMASNLSFIANFVDTNRPTVAITAPTANQRWSNEVFTVKGTASDNAALASVQYQLNGAEWNPATTANNWSNWTAAVNLTPGTNTLKVYSMDLTDNRSPTNSLSFVYVLSAPLTVGITGKGTLTPNLSNAVMELGKLNTITATAATGYAFKNWTDGSGLAVTSNRALQFTMASNLTFIANFVDTNRPTVVITAPTANQRWSNEVFTVKGTASDNAALASVQYQLNGAGWNPATTANNWSNWTAALNLTPGTNTLKVYATDLTGNNSTTNSMSFIYVLSAPLTVGITGKGTMTPNLNNSLLELGKLNTITATAAVGYVFANWTDGSGLVVTTNRALQFTMASNLTFIANFVDPNWPTVAITAPTANQRWSNEVFTVKGVASDNAALASVQYQLNRAEWNPATTANNWSNWTVAVNLTPGTNTLKVYSMDLTGNRSPTNILSFVYVSSAPLTVGITGKGTFSPDYSNALLELGKLNTITATAAEGYAFSNWTDGKGLTVTSDRALQFTMASNLTFIANFVDTSWPAVAVTAPTANQHWSNEVFTVNGTASDNAALASVLYQLNRAEWSPATTANNWSNWTAMVNLTPGTNTLQVYATDLTGNNSTTNSVSFVYVQAEVPGAIQPALLSMPRTSSEGFSFTITVETGRAYRIQTSTNTLEWLDVLSFVASGSTFDYSDRLPTILSQHFYRVVSP